MESAAAGDLTGRVTNDGSREFQRMAHATNEMLAATGRTVATIAGAVEEQAATTNEMGRSPGEAAASTGTIAANIASVADATAQTRAHSEEANRVAAVLNRSGSDLTNLAATFKW